MCPPLSSSDIEKLRVCLNALLVLWSIVRSSAPQLFLTGTDEKEFIENLLLVYRNISELVSSLKIELNEDKLTTILSSLNSNETLVLVVSSSLMKRLIDAGVPRERLVSIGGPLTVEDLKALNPNLSEEAVKGVEARLKKFWNELERRARGIRTVILLLEKDNKVDRLIAERANLISERISAEVKVIYLSNINNSLNVLPRFFGGR